MNFKGQVMTGALVLAVAAAGAIGYTIWQRRAAEATAAQVAPEVQRAVSDRAGAASLRNEARVPNRTANQAVVAPGNSIGASAPAALPPANAGQPSQQHAQARPRTDAPSQSTPQAPVQAVQAPANPAAATAPVAPTLTRGADETATSAPAQGSSDTPSMPSPGVSDVPVEPRAGQRSLIPTADQSTPIRRTHWRARHARPEICD